MVAVLDVDSAQMEFDPQTLFLGVHPFTAATCRAVSSSPTTPTQAPVTLKKIKPKPANSRWMKSARTYWIETLKPVSSYKEILTLKCVLSVFACKQSCVLWIVHQLFISLKYLVPLTHSLIDCSVFFQVGKDTVQTTEDQIMKRDMPPAFIK